MNVNELPVVNKPLVCPTIVGRAIELAALHTIVDEVEGGHSHVVLLSGEAGIGKSRLVAEAKTYATAQGFLLLQGQCFPTDRSCPYAPLLELLRAHLATSSVEHVASALSPLLPDLLPPPSDLPPLFSPRNSPSPPSAAVR
jgi:predicted ATPase